MKHLTIVIVSLLIAVSCRNGKEIPARQHFDTEEYCFNGTSIISMNGRWGIADTSGNIILPARYDSVAYITGETAFAREGRLYYLTDTEGHILDETISSTGMSDTELLRWADDVSSRLREEWDSILDSYAELASLCSQDEPDHDAISKKSEEILGILDEIPGSMAKDQRTRFDNIRRSWKNK